MNTDNSPKTEALTQIDAIYKTMQDNLKIAVYGPVITATGIGVASIPLIEYLFSFTLNPLLEKISPYPFVTVFLVKTIFYWSSFALIPQYFKKFESTSEGNQLLSKMNAINTFFPFIPISTAIALVITHHANLIAPMICIIVGSQLLQFSNFTSSILKKAAWIQIGIGIASILATQFAIPNLWMYTIALHGLTLAIAGIFLTKSKTSN